MTFENIKYISWKVLLKTNLSIINENSFFESISNIENNLQRQTIYGVLVAFCLGYNRQYVNDTTIEFVSEYLST